MKYIYYILLFFLSTLCVGQSTLFFINPSRGLQSLNTDNAQSQLLVQWQNYKMRCLALDKANQKIYWTDIVGDRIMKSNLDGNSIETVLDKNLDLPDGIDVDNESKLMIWMDNGHKTIMRMDLTNGQVEPLMKFDLITLNRIKFAPQSKYIYWTEWGNNEPYGKVKRARYDGSNVEEIYRIKDGFILGLAIDEVHGKIYWTDSGFNVIQRANMDGSQLETLIDKGLSIPNSIAIDPEDNTMYWSELGNRSIKSATLTGTQIEELKIRNLNEPQDIVLLKTRPLAVAESIFDEYTLYPNPFTNEIFIDVKSEQLNIEITDIDGRLISIEHTSNINTSAWMPALYIMKITDHQAHRIVYRKCIKI